MEVVWTERAKDRLSGILEYIAEDSLTRAHSWIEDLINRGLSIGDQPYMGRVVPEYEHSDIREIIHGDYRIIYILRNERVEILTVRHCSQLLPFEENDI